ncbi:hypothetical protein [Lentzea sp.]|uniref:hypothetical protein n=1 Tax=Lentzea sp. TaxID=56099 RepID=UPI002C34CCD0|nr:hypothetical protein [Lentzea sp.]HUQ59623.1 hypothetical protein [Lentzea sp.]
MNQPPPRNWQQQPPGWPQQQPQGWHQPPGWGPPPRKNKAPLVVGIIAGVLVLGGVIAAGAVHLNVNADGGSPKRPDKLPSACGNVSEAALAKARTTNPNGLGSRESKIGDDTSTICSWNQTKGVDGKGHRSTDVYVNNDLDDAQSDFDRRVAQHMDTRGVPQQKPLDGLGDQAVAVLVEGDSAFTDIWIIARKGGTMIQVDYSGWDAGLFTNTKPDVAEFEAAAKGIAEEMVAKA